MFGADYPTWSVGVNLSYSIPNRSAKAAAAYAKLSQDQALASFRRLELQVAAEVRTAARGVESGFKRVASTQAARRLAAQRLDAESKKFDAGMSTNFLVTQAQRDLATAEVNELRAISDYRKSVINFQRVQEAGVSGTGAVAVLAGSSRRRAGQPGAALRQRRVGPVAGGRETPATSAGRTKGGPPGPLSLSPPFTRSLQLLMPVDHLSPAASV